MKHGERGAERIEARRDMNALLRLLRESEREEAVAVNGVAKEGVWIERIAVEVSQISG